MLEVNDIVKVISATDSGYLEKSIRTILLGL